MAFTDVRDTQIAVRQFSLSNGVSVADLQRRITSLNINDAGAVQAEVKRCNNRCNGNDVDVSVKTLALTPDGTGQLPSQTFSVKFKIVSDAQ